MKRKQYVLFGEFDSNSYSDYCIVDTINKLHTSYFYSLIDVLSNLIDKNNYIKNKGRINFILNNKIFPGDQIILESDIPITAENYPELLI